MSYLIFSYKINSDSLRDYKVSINFVWVIMILLNLLWTKYFSPAIHRYTDACMHISTQDIFKVKPACLLIYMHALFSAKEGKGHFLEGQERRGGAY